MSSTFYDRVYVSTATIGQGTLTYGSAITNAFMTPLEAGASDAESVEYIIEEGLDFELGIGTIGGTSTTQTRSVTVSKIAGVVGTAKMNLAGTARVRFIAPASFLAGLAPLASPALTGVPTAPTAAADTNTTQIATTAFAKAEADAAEAASQPLDADLTTIAGLTATTDNFMQAKASAWASRTPAQVNVDLLAANFTPSYTGGVARTLRSKIEENATPADWGAVGDGTTDDKAALALAVTAAAASGFPIILTRPHRIATSMSFAGVELVFFGGSFIPDSGAVVTLTSTTMISGTTGNCFDTSQGGTFRVTAADLRGPELKISNYVPADMTAAADAGVAAALKDLFNLNYYGLDLEGRRIVLNDKLVMSTITGLTSKSVWKHIHNGEIAPSASYPSPTTGILTANCDMTANSTTVLCIATGALAVDMEVSGPGIPRGTFVVGVTANVSFVMSREAMSTGTGRTVNFKEHHPIFDFRGFTSLTKVIFDRLHFTMTERGACYFSSKKDDIVEFRSCQIVRPETYGIVTSVPWRDVTTPAGGGGFVVRDCDFITNDAAILPANRTRIGVLCGGDARIEGNRWAYYKHAVIFAGGANLFLRNHPFSGDASDNPVLAGVIFQRVGNHVIAGNYIDHGWIEFTNETFAYNAPGVAIGGAVIVGNRFTTATTAATEGFIVLHPFGTGAIPERLIVTGNAFQPLIAGPAVALNRVDVVDLTDGTLDTTAAWTEMIFENNSFENVTTKTHWPPPLVPGTSVAPFVGSFDLTGNAPFSDALSTFTLTLPQLNPLEIGHATDTTLARSSAGNLSIEGNVVYRAGGTDVAVADGGSGRSTGTTAYGLIAAGTTATGVHQTLAAGALTEVLVGGGASALPVWTTATGTGAPVRATSPTLVTPTLGVAAGTSLEFPATQVSNAGVNVLDDYEEGTFTPVLTFVTPGDLSVVYSTQIGRYTKIGNRVFFQIAIITSTFTHTTAASNFRITGLPFTALNNAGTPLAAVSMDGWTWAGYTQLGAYVIGNNTEMQIRATGSGQATQFLGIASVPTGGQIDLYITGHYEVAS